MLKLPMVVAMAACATACGGLATGGVDSDDGAVAQELRNCVERQDVPMVITAVEAKAVGEFSLSPSGVICYHGRQDTCGTTLYRYCVAGSEDYTYCPSDRYSIRYEVEAENTRQRLFCRLY